MEAWGWENCTSVFGRCELVDVTTLNQHSLNDTEDLPASVFFRDQTRFWIQRVLVPIIVGVGVLSNCVTMVVLTRRRMRSSTNLYLTALAASDLLYLLFMFSLSLSHYPNIDNAKYFIYWQYRRFGIWLTDATSSTSIWLTVSFTVERYVAVCHPMRGKAFCTESRARKVIFTVYLLCFLVTASTAFEWQTVAYLRTVNNSTTGTISVGVTTTSLGDNETYLSFVSWFSSITFMFLPLLLLGVFNCFLIHAVHKSQRQRCKMTQFDQTDLAQSQENRITITLIAVVILFLVCQIPSAITLIYKSFYIPKFGSTGDNILRGLGNIFNFLVAVNASCNFILYCALSDKYRRTFLLTFLSCWHRSPRHMNSLYYNSSVYSNHSRNMSTRSTNTRVTSQSLLRRNRDTQAPLTRHTSLNVPRNHQVSFA